MNTNTNTFEPMQWETIPDVKLDRRYAVLSGSTVHAFNQRDDIKYRQQTEQDIFFKESDILDRTDDNIYRVRLDKGDWKWFEVDHMDLCDIKLTSRRHELQKIETQLMNIYNEEATKSVEILKFAQSIQNPKSLSTYVGPNKNANPCGEISLSQTSPTILSTTSKSIDLDYFKELISRHIK